MDKVLSIFAIINQKVLLSNFFFTNNKCNTLIGNIQRILGIVTNQTDKMMQPNNFKARQIGQLYLITIMNICALK